MAIKLEVGKANNGLAISGGTFFAASNINIQIFLKYSLSNLCNFYFEGTSLNSSGHPVSN